VCSDAAGSDSHPDAVMARRQYLRWTPELQERFLDAVEKLGGLETATPSRIAVLMQVLRIPDKLLGQYSRVTLIKFSASFSAKIVVKSDFKMLVKPLPVTVSRQQSCERLLCC